MKSAHYHAFSVGQVLSPFFCSFFFYRQLLPYGRADLTASASLQPIRSSSLQLHGLRPCRYGNLDS
jgi:hypothetical protein